MIGPPKLGFTSQFDLIWFTEVSRNKIGRVAFASLHVAATVLGLVTDAPISLALADDLGRRAIPLLIA